MPGRLPSSLFTDKERPTAASLHRLVSRTDLEAPTVNSSTPDNSIYTYGLQGTNQMANDIFSTAIIIFLFGLAAICLGVRLSQLSHRYLRQISAMVTKTAEAQRYWQFNHTFWWPWTLRHVLYAPLGKVRHNREVQLSKASSVGTMPSRFHLSLIVVYAAFNLAYCLVLDWHQKTPAILAELRGRSGDLAMINLLPTFLFAFRNNPFSPLLQVSYDTFNLLHRWTARIVIVESIVHGLAWLSNKILVEGKGAVSQSMHEQFIYTGVIAAALATFLLIQAWSPVRHAAYETFIMGHRAIVLVIITCIYIHLDDGQLPQFFQAKIVIGMWITEWVIRTIRIVYYNVSRRRRTVVLVEALPDEACRLTFDLARPWYFHPGSHVHIYLPSISWFSSHPFSVAWTQEYSDSRASVLLNDKLSIKERTAELERQPSISTSLSLIVRARTGMTRKLYDRAVKASQGRVVLSGFVEGSYGGLESLSSYGTVVLFAGGVGITHQMGYIRQLLAGYDQGTVATRKILLVWSVPSTSVLEWVRPYMDSVLRMRGRTKVLRVHLFVTKPRSQSETLNSDSGTVQLFPGRCDPQAIVDREVIERIGAMVVTVCGPGALADDVRRATRRRAQAGAVEFVEESFTY